MKKTSLKCKVAKVFMAAVVLFLSPLLLPILVLKFIFTPFGMRRMMMMQRMGNPMGFNPKMKFAMAEKVRAMSDEEFALFKEKMDNRFCCKK